MFTFQSRASWSTPWIKMTLVSKLSPKRLLFFASAQRAWLLLCFSLTHCQCSLRKKNLFLFLLQEISHFRRTQNNFLIESSAWISWSFGSESSGRNRGGTVRKLIFGKCLKSRHIEIKVFSSRWQFCVRKNLCVMYGIRKFLWNYSRADSNFLF